MWIFFVFIPACAFGQKVFIVSIFELFPFDLVDVDVEGDDSFVDGHQVIGFISITVLDLSDNLSNLILFPRQNCNNFTLYSLTVFMLLREDFEIDFVFM